MLFGMGPLELIVILVVVLVIFGPKNLPKLGKSLGKTVKSIREGMDEAQAEAKGDSAEVSDVVVEDVDSDVDETPFSAKDPNAPTSSKTSRTESGSASSDSGAKVCPHCGVRNPAGNHFCSKCGTKLDD